ncbi:hypothetical protein Afil01_51690 [Actinorhabdospora filicis]|uniref:HNH nuclease domain-containing protein n=1 Tax=Actinorhabdospora filicis TaxID=1785913 RepID=A0A9W6W5G6_9ACTN|nr:HNH endonuclease signature motif containing protein [Actinorhabdospora filicis]GLZ80362.1 hypothetical protein Afil01_51690 [Actinorhabdospora filicis]
MLAPLFPAAVSLPDLLSRISGVRREEGSILAALSVVHRRGDLAAEGFPSLSTWLMVHAGLSSARARSWQRAATEMPFLPALAEALSRGEISIEHALPVFHATARGHRETFTRELAEPVPSDYVPGHRLHTLDEVFADIARHELPGTVAAAVKELLSRIDEERQAREFTARLDRRHVSLTPTLDGSWHLAGHLDDLAGATVSAALDSLTRPDGEGDRRTAGQRRADALRELAENPPPDLTGPRLTPPTVVVTIDHEALVTKVSALPDAGLHDRALTNPWADLDGTPIPPAIARRFACDARVLPAVLNGDGRVLDLARTRRLVSIAQRRALSIEQPTCAFPHCTVSWRRCEAHHIHPWSEGGPTTLDNLAHLCPNHHGTAHGEAWTFTRITAPDPERGHTPGDLLWTETTSGREFTVAPRRHKRRKPTAPPNRSAATRPSPRSMGGARPPRERPQETVAEGRKESAKS